MRTLTEIRKRDWISSILAFFLWFPVNDQAPSYIKDLTVPLFSQSAERGQSLSLSGSTTVKPTPV